MANRGRPKKEINQIEFEKLCTIQCTENEICAWFEISADTLCRWCRKTYKMNFADIFAIKRETGRISLRRTQLQLAEKNAAMAIFLGKQYLGQKDDTGNKVSVNIGKNDDDDSNIVIYLPDDGRNRQVTPNAEDNASTGATV